MDDRKYWVWLSSIPGIGAKRFRLLKEHFKTPEGVWNASKRELLEMPGLKSVIPSILNSEIRDNIDKYMHKIKELGVSVMTIDDAEYPDILRNIHEPPQVLFIKGNTNFADYKTVAIVGSRNATSYGIDMAKKLAYELASRGIAVVSGMARGVDTSAHKGALEAGGMTIAVMGCGLDVAYPPENSGLIKKVMEKGSVISEYMLGAKPVAGNFPARNRIISGLSIGVIVIEASEKSGSLITADFALEQGREVFAVPGNANSDKSRGANKLIKEGAKLVTCVEDVLEEFQELKGMKTDNNPVIEENLLNGLDQEERKVIECIGQQAAHIDYIARTTGLGVQKVNAVLMMLELKGFIRQNPGKFFARS